MAASSIDDSANCSFSAITGRWIREPPPRRPRRGDARHWPARGQLVLDHVPDDSVADAVIRMDEDITKCFGLRDGTDTGSRFVIHLGEPVEGFSDDLEIPFDGLPKQAISFVLLLRHAANGIADERRRVADVFEQFRSLKMDTAVAEWC